MTRDYSQLMSEMAADYQRHAPISAKLHQRALSTLVDGGSHSIRLMEPFAPRIRKAYGAWLEDEDGNQILDFWQGHYANILGHNPAVVTEALAEALSENYGLQGGFTDRQQIEAAEILCQQTGQDMVRFTTSGTLATMYAIILARAFTGRELILKVGGGWHGAHLWGLKGLGWNDGFGAVESDGLPNSVPDQVIVTGYNNSGLLEEKFRRYGDKLACFIVEPVIGAGGMMPATKEFLQTARKLCDSYGTLLIFDEVISGFRFRAGDAGLLFGVKPDLVTLGKAIGGGMPVSAVAGRADVLKLTSREMGFRVKFSGGTYSAHAGSMLAANIYMQHLVENEVEVYAKLAESGAETRRQVQSAFASEGIKVRFAGDRNNDLRLSSLHMLVFPFKEGLELNTPEEIFNPSICDQALSEKVIQLAMLLEDVHVVHGLGSSTTAHSSQDLQILGEAFGRVARRIKPYL